MLTARMIWYTANAEEDYRNWFKRTDEAIREADVLIDVREAG